MRATSIISALLAIGLASVEAAAQAAMFDEVLDRASAYELDRASASLLGTLPKISVPR